MIWNSGPTGKGPAARASVGQISASDVHVIVTVKNGEKGLRKIAPNARYRSERYR